MSYITDSFDDEIVRLLNNGGVGLLPTDTIYGLSCRARDKMTVKKVRELKARAEDKPFVVLISNTGQLKDLGIISTDAAGALRYWPGKLTIICKAQKAPSWLHGGTHSLAVRQPDDEILRELIDKVGPIISTSANLAGQKPALSVSAAQKYFGDKLDFYVDRGPINKKPSTIIRVTFSKVEVVRQGALKIKEAK